MWPHKAPSQWRHRQCRCRFQPQSTHPCCVIRCQPGLPKHRRTGWKRRNAPVQRLCRCRFRLHHKHHGFGLRVQISRQQRSSSRSLGRQVLAQTQLPSVRMCIRSCRRLWSHWGYSSRHESQCSQPRSTPCGRPPHQQHMWDSCPLPTTCPLRFPRACRSCMTAGDRCARGSQGLCSRSGRLSPEHARTLRRTRTHTSRCAQGCCRAGPRKCSDCCQRGPGAEIPSGYSQYTRRFRCHIRPGC